MSWNPKPHPIFAVGDTVWVYLRGDHDARVDGKVAAIVALPGWRWSHYVVEIDTPMDPLLYIYDGSEMLREPDPETVRINTERERRLTNEALEELRAEIEQREEYLNGLRAELDARKRELLPVRDGNI